MATHSTISQQINSSEFWPIKGGICHAFRSLGGSDQDLALALSLSLFIFL